MTTKIIIEERELDGSYVGPIKVEIGQDLQVRNLDGLVTFKKEMDAIKDDAEQSATNASTSATNASTSATNAAASAAEAKTYVDTIASGVKYKGEWDASKGAFPIPTLTPKEQVDYYRISVAGTMTNPANPAQKPVTVGVNDSLYWNETKDVWYEIESQGIHTVNNTLPDHVGNIEINARDIPTTSGDTVQVELDKVKPWVIACQTKEQFEARRDENKRLNPASGFHDFGKHLNIGNGYYAINEGMWTTLGASNTLFMGRTSATSNTTGSSISDFPKTIIAGVLSELRTGTDLNLPLAIKFPPAEKGLRTFDSSTGASVVHASAAEAFGSLDTSSGIPAGTGATWDITTSTVTRGSVGTFGVVYGIEQGKGKLTATVISSHDATLQVKDGDGGGDPTLQEFQLTANKPSTVIVSATRTDGQVYYRVPTSVTGQTLQVLALSALDVNEEVVLRRVDMGGGEYFLRKITKTDSYVYPKGNIQSELTTANGVATTVNTQRPSSYFDQYEGQNAGQKRGWDWNTISDEDKLAIVSDFTNLTYWDGKDLYQWCLRVRTFAGAGNGDWLNIDSNYHTAASSAILIATPRTRTRIGVQGNQDVIQDTSGGGNFFAGTRNVSENGNPQVGVFTQSKNASSGAVNGGCYFQVWFVVPRLNQGAYHPKFNEFGTKGLWPNYGGPTITWHNGAAKKPKSTADCFNFGSSHLTSFTTVGGGNIGSTSGREDGRFYDAIYASGLGGVDDYRVTCKDTGKPEYVAGKMPEIINGNYRGAEKLKFTTIQNDALGTGQDVGKANHWKLVAGGTSGFLYMDVATHFNGAKGDSIFIADKDAGVYFKAKIGTLGGNYIALSSIEGVNGYIPVDGSGLSSATGNIYLITEATSDITVSGEYYQMNAIGNPANLLAAGIGSGYWEWIPVIPDSTVKLYEATHPASESKLVARLYTDNQGGSWFSSSSLDIDAVLNGVNENWSSARVGMYVYKTKARQTQPTTNKAILHGKAGIGDVFVSSDSRDAFGRQLGFSLTGSIMSNNIGVKYANRVVTGYTFSTIGRYLPDTGLTPEHTEFKLSTPSNNSNAFKTLWSQFSENKQSNVQFSYQQLIHNGTDWGDDKKINIVDGDSHRNNANGLEVKYGTHELVKPLGYTW